MNKSLSGLILFVMLCCPFVSASAEDCENENTEEKAWAVDLSTAVLSDYLFRGINYYPGTSIQPEVAASYSLGDLGSLNGSVWGHFSAEDNDAAAERFTELDYTLSYDLTLGITTISLGHVWYVYPDDDDEISDTAEYFAAISFDTLLTPTLSFYRDYQDYDNEYYELGFSQKIETDTLGEGFNVTPAVAFGFASNAEKAYNDDSGLMFVNFGLSSDLPLGGITVTPTLNYNFKVDDATVNEFWMGMSFAYSL